ncbi:iron-sulfur-binding ferredoxin reductase [Pseudomonas cremoricolorata]|uniref:iron-sulfur-binding ferredoxin reductase n=1 Tax=Pseudomonas cremoricolorata TaxID=157783 RepID=UPI0004151DE1|nr:iron-sulfur-binding ferredoxin reductase [Pseudomonas cremoricolorata]
MPELRVGARHWSVAADSNLLDALLAAGIAVPHSCRAGSCHACLVRCLHGQPADARPEALDAAQRAEGWRLACQCRVLDDLHVAPFDPRNDGLPSEVVEVHWLGEVLRVRLLPARPLRYQPGQHAVLWLHGVARPYSLASLPGEDRYLEFHIDCRRQGAFSERARQLRSADAVSLGEVRGGALHYDPDWHDRPLWLLAAGTGLAPLWGILREALRHGHAGPIRLLHVAHEASGHYQADALNELTHKHRSLRVEEVLADQLQEVLAALRLESRQTVALACGAPATVEQFARRLFIAGLPRNQLYADVFTPAEDTP